jgi:hypothetical protein
MPYDIPYLFGVALEVLEKIEDAWAQDALAVTAVAMSVDPAPGRHHPGRTERLDELRRVIHTLERLVEDYAGET